MDLVTEPDIYSPSIDEMGNYIDKIPSFNIIKKGLLCSCGSRKDKIYETYTTFSMHIKTKTHQKWLSELNKNKMNFYSECEKLKEVVGSQKIIIARLEREINTKLKTIDYLTQQLMSKESNVVEDLLTFD
jgi:predicted RNase H-like nuclease (RuvC/YqgF family)